MISTIITDHVKANSHRHVRHDKTVLSVSRPLRRCELDSRQLKTVADRKFYKVWTRSGQSSYSHRHSRHVTDRTVLSCLAGGVNWALAGKAMRSVVSVCPSSVICFQSVFRTNWRLTWIYACVLVITELARRNWVRVICQGEKLVQMCGDECYTRIYGGVLVSAERWP